MTAETGFDAGRAGRSLEDIGLFLDGLHCAGCVNRVERALRAAEGVDEAAVNYTNHRALVRFDTARSSADALVGVVQELGYDATPFDPDVLERPAAGSQRAALARLLVAAFLAGNVMWLSVALYSGSYQGMDPAVRDVLRWITLALTVPAISWCAAPFWRGAWNGLRRGELSVDVPIVAGISTAFAVGVAGTIANTSHLYMDSAAMIVFLVLLGRTLERTARGKASSAVDRLAALAPPKALLCTDDGPVEVDATSLVVGDRVRVPAGQAVPVDGRLLSGSTEVDEAPFTGESRPVLRETGDFLIGGSRNLLVEAEIEVVARPSEGTLAKMAALLERAQAERPRIQLLADRVASVFAPAVLLLAVGTAGFWLWQGAEPLKIALATASVLIVACPCALGLATPAAITASIGRAAALGILVKSGEALERCARIDAVALDKTGTLTEGRFAVREIHPAEGVSEADLLAWAAAVEGSSTHPVAEALRRAAEEAELVELTDRRTHPGQGVEAREGDVWMRAGSPRWLESLGISLGADLREAAAKAAASGLSLVAVARDQRALGLVALWDPPREDAAQAIEGLRRLGVESFLITGDHADAARLAAEAAGLPVVHHEQSPEDKVAQVRALRAAGHEVLFAGDGINDAAALRAADVGLAMHRGSDVTLHAADLVVRAPRLDALPTTLGLARACVARIRENLGFAVLYNLCAVPLAAAGWLEPLHAAIAMSASSLVVTGNAIRLLRWKPA